MTEQPPLTLHETAVALHEWFISLTRAGFTKSQAMDIICASAQGFYRNQ